MDTILFLCPHGAAKSVLAAAIFQKLADRHGLALQATSAGTDPDPAIPAAVLDYLKREELRLLNSAPRLVTEPELTTAARIISMGCEVGDRVPAHTPLEQWDDVPPVSQDLVAATQVIQTRVEQLIAELLKKT